VSVSPFADILKATSVEITTRGFSLWASLRFCALRWKALEELGAWAAASWANGAKGKIDLAQLCLSWL